MAKPPKEFDVKGLIEQIRQKLDMKILDFADAVRELEDGDSKTEISQLRFCDLFNVSSVKNEDECLAEMVKFIDKINNIGIGDINKLLPQCDRTILSKTLGLLDEDRGGGFNGYFCSTTGKKRGKKYKLETKD